VRDEAQQKTAKTDPNGTADPSTAPGAPHDTDATISAIDDHAGGPNGATTSAPDGSLPPAAKKLRRSDGGGVALGDDEEFEEELEEEDDVADEEEGDDEPEFDEEAADEVEEEENATSVAHAADVLRAGGDRLEEEDSQHWQNGMVVDEALEDAEDSD
jgi:hypothetical protein